MVNCSFFFDAVVAGMFTAGLWKEGLSSFCLTGGEE